MRTTVSVKIAITCLAALSARGALALPEYWDTLQTVYLIKAGTPLAGAKCLSCHIRPPFRNSFGKEVERSLGQAAKLTAEMLHSIDSLDSDGDGVPNGEELAKGSLPADPQSKPAKELQVAKIEPPISQGVFPNHSFHPLLVHFPIGIFLFGGFLDAIGRRSNRPTIREAATWNIGFGALAGIGALVTGLLARWRMGFEIKGLIQTHLILAIACTLLMTVIAYWNLRRKPDGAAYWICLALACTAVAITGHFGSVIVHG